MATRTTNWCTDTCLTCASSLPTEAVICVPGSIVNPVADGAYGFVNANITSYRPSTKYDNCGSCKHVYTLQYDDSQLQDGYALVPAYIKDVMCGCITALIESGFEAPLTTVSVTDTESVDLTVNHTGNNYDLQADVNISANPGNALTIEPDGLFAAPTGGASCCYEEGTVEPLIQGVVAMMEGAGDVVLPVQGSIADGLLVNLGANNDVNVTGTVNAVQSGAWTVNVSTLPAVTGSVSVTNGAGAAAVNIQDGGNSITVDGAVTATVSGTVAATQSGVWVLGTNSGVDIGDVTINNGVGASAVNIQDGGNSITVDAVDLDIRDLVAATDSVTIHGDVGAVDQFNLTNSDPIAVALVDSNGDQVSSFGGGVQYTDGNVDATVTGTAAMWKDAGDVITSVSASTPLPVNVVAGGTSGVQYTDGDVDASVTGTAVMWKDAGNVITSVSASTPLPVTGTVAATQSGTWNIDDITGTISLPTGAATETTLAALEAHFNDVSVSNAPTLKGFGVLPVGGHYIGSDQAEAGSTATVLNFTGHAMRVGDYLIAYTGTAGNLGAWSSIISTTTNSVTVSDAFPAVPAALDTYIFFRPTPVAVSYAGGNVGGLIVNIDGDYQESVARGILKPEGNIHNSGDYAVPAWGVRNDNGAATFTGDGRYSPIAVDANGRVGIADLGGSITVDGTVAATQSGTWVLGANSGVDIGDVTVNNAAGASAVNIQDGGNSITVDAVDLDIRDLVAATDSVTIHGDVGVADQFNLTNSDPFAVAIVDANGDQITSFGGGVQYTDGDTDATVTGTAVMWKDAGDVITSVSASTPLPVDVGTVTVTGTVNAAQSGAWSVEVNNAAGASAVNIQDGGNTITVDAVDLDIRDLVAATDSVTVHGDVGVVDQFNLTNSDPLAVAIVDANGDQITSFGGGVQYTDGDTDATVTGTAVMWKDAGDVITSVSASTPLPVDVGTVTVTGTVAATQSGTWNINNISGTVSLPTGAATEATLAGVLTTTDFQARINTLGQKTMANSTPVVLASDQSEVTVGTVDTIATGQFTAATQTVTLSDLNGVGVIGVQTVATGWGIGTIICEATIDGTNYLPVSMYRYEGSNRTFLATTFIGSSTLLYIGNYGYTSFRVRCNSFASGTLDVTISGSTQSADEYAQAPIPSGTSTIGVVTLADASGDLNNFIAPADAMTAGAFGNGLADTCVVELYNGTTYDRLRGDTTGLNAQGNIPHDTADAGNPVKIGGVAVSGSATPTSVAAGDRTRAIFNQAGIPYTMAGHPNLITREYDFGTAAQTDVNLAAAVVAADERIYVTRFEATCDSANTVAVSVRAGFGTANVPTPSATGVSGMIASHPGIAAGSGLVSGSGAGIIAVGGAGEEPRLTSSAATTGNLHVVISYYLIDETP